MEKKSVIITGGSRGIGLAISNTLIDNGYIVYCISRTKPDNNNIRFIECDLSDVSSMHDMSSVVKSIRPDHLINNVGIDSNGPFLEQTLESINRVINTNFISHYLLTQDVISNLISNDKPGKVLFITSIWGSRSTKYKSLYSASKFALEGLSKSLSSEFIDRDVHINCIAPSFTDINSTTSPQSNYYRTEEHLDSLRKKINGGRLVDPQEVADTVVWMLSDKCSYATGQTITIDRGDIF